MRKRLTTLGLTIVALLCILPATASATGAPVNCNVVAATNGSDSNPGTEAAPLLSAKAAVAAAATGQTICFRAGIYSWDEGLSVRTTHTTLTSYPGEAATLTGLLRVERSATGTVIENLKLDGKNPDDLFNPLVYADSTVLRDNEITNEHTTNCVHLARYYDAPAPADVVIENNSIHDCGALPAGNHEHGIYLAAGKDTIIRDNLIYDNADRGIQLYTGDTTGTRITGNVIEGNGEGLLIASTNDYGAPSDSLVTHNIIADSLLRHNVESSYEDSASAGTNNVVTQNCIHGAEGWYKEADGSGIQNEQIGFTAKNNTVADPKFQDAANADFTLAPQSPCTGILEGAGPTQPIVLESPKVVDAGARAPLSGTVPSGVTGHVSILVRGHGNWHRIGQASITGSRFHVRMRIHRTQHFKARAQGARDSNAVKVAAKHGKRKG